ncbi:hypothetical protein DFH06DRAFT_1204822 [Mycena polygramma]|nr:hypothetical protein DFH06DRAFT_1204822 [Mycena polygramma]
MSTQEHARNVTALSKFLLLPAEPGLTEPPPIPLSLDGLPSAVHLDAARHYVERYPFDRKFYKYTRKTRQRYPYDADSEFKEKARRYLQACINVDRSALTRLRTFGSYDAAHEQEKFVRNVIFPRRWRLEELASEMLALVELVRWETHTVSAVVTPTDTELPEEKTVKDSVRERDKYCRLTGVARLQKSLSSAQIAELRRAGRVFAQTLVVVHGLPLQMGQTSFELVAALTGINCEDWVADSVENAFLAQPSVHLFFGAFKVFLEWADDGNIMIRGRTGAGDPIPSLATVVNDRRQLCDLPGQFLDTPLRARFDSAIPDVAEKYFLLHKFIGDIVWMCGGESVSDDEEDDEEHATVSNANIGALLDKLHSPEMDLLPVEAETIFGGSRFRLVHKDVRQQEYGAGIEDSQV